MSTNLDIKDKKIISALDINPQISTSKLAKEVRLSQQVVDYRIKRLQEQNIISKFATIFNLAKLGYEQYRVFFQLKSITEKEKEDLLNYLNKKTYWTALVGGKWDLFCVVCVKNYDEFDEFLDELFKTFPSVKDYEALYTVYHEYHKHKYINNSINKDSNKINNNSNIGDIRINVSSTKDIIKIDDIDYKIINFIKSDCRESALSIGNKIKVSYKTVQNRIKQMQENQIISGYRIFLKYEDYKPYILLLSFSSYGKKSEKGLFSYAHNNNNITQITKLFGRYSIMFHIRIKSEEEFQNLIIDLRNNFPIIGDFEIIPIFKDVSIDTFPINIKSPL